MRNLTLWTVLTGSVLLSACSSLTPAPDMAQYAGAMKFDVHGDVLVLSGNSVQSDAAYLRAALTPTIKTVVLDGLKGRDFYAASSLSETIKDARVRTVAKGVCDYNCVRMFLSGTERMFASGSDLNRTMLIISGNSSIYESGTMQTDAAHVAALINGMPRSLVEKWAFQESWGAGNMFSPPFMLVYHPQSIHPLFGGNDIVGCPAGTVSNELKIKCSPVSGYNAVSAKILTSAELFKIPNS